MPGPLPRHLTAALAVVALASGCAALRPRPSDDVALQQKAAVEKGVRIYLGTRYRTGGTDRRGMDCSGFTRTVYARAGITLPRTAVDQFSAGHSVDKDELQYGDLLFFNTKRLATSPCACWFSWWKSSWDVPGVYGITHTGIYVGGGRFVHASPTSGVSHARLEDDYWRERYVGARRVMEDLPEGD
ncbi:MAG: C40 family peptidase [Deltaproteobacteria bacterium]|nr:C40 family peptidase [Deltaproteobacteria bacterium]